MTQIGHNRSPFDEASDAVETVYAEARHWLDGASVQTQAEADAVGTLLDMARKARKQADAARVEEKKPLDDAVKAVQSKFRPLIDRCDMIADAAKKALTPFLAEQERVKREAEAKARAEADAAQKAAQEAFAAAKGLEDREAAEAAADAAKKAEIAARVAAKDGARAKGGERAVSLRTTRKGEVRDLRALMSWLWANDRAALMGFADQYVAGAVRAGQTQMDGVEIVTVEAVA